MPFLSTQGGAFALGQKCCLLSGNDIHLKDIFLAGVCVFRFRCAPTWYSRVSNMLMLKTLPAAKGRRNMKAKLEPLSRSF